MEVIQTISTILAIFCFILCIHLYITKPNIKLYLIPVLFYLISVCIFYIFRFLVVYGGILPNYLEYFSFTNWSSMIRLQGILTIFFYLVIVGKYDIRFGNYIKSSRVGRKLWKHG